MSDTVISAEKARQRAIAAIKAKEQKIAAASFGFGAEADRYRRSGSRGFGVAVLTLQRLAPHPDEEAGVYLSRIIAEIKERLDCDRDDIDINVDGAWSGAIVEAMVEIERVKREAISPPGIN